MEHIFKQFLDTCSKYPEGIALEEKDNKVSYDKLKKEIIAYRQYLIKVGIQKGDGVAIRAEHSVELISVLLAVISLGAYYTPIDKRLPKERQSLIIKESEVKLIITDSLIEGSVSSLNIKDFKEKNSVLNDSFENQINASDFDSGSLAYILYTSGTTGLPNGVEIEHKALYHYCNWAVSQYKQETKKMIFPFFTSLSFDLTITSIFPPLISGGKIVIYPMEPVLENLESIYSHPEINSIKLTPSHLKMIRDPWFAESNIHTYIVGGENFSRDLAAKIQSSHRESVCQYNEYGPTEATVGCMIHLYDDSETEESVSIGKAIRDMDVFLLDEKGNVSNKEGELIIAGKGLARAYHNQPELTKQKFITLKEFPNQRLYRSGDWVKVNNNGNMYFVRRIDDQLKLSGHRVELSDIESQYKQVLDVDFEIQVEKDQRGNQILDLYFLKEDGHTLSSGNEFKNKLNDCLPSYLIPKSVYSVKSWPLTTNGKLDRRSLKKKASLVLNKSKYEFVSSLEKSLAKIWEGIFPNCEIIPESDFFLLGGDSIQLLELLESLSFLSDAEIKVRDLYQHSSFSTQIDLIKIRSQEKIGLDSHLRPESIPLSSMQFQMFIQQQLHPQSIVYNEPWVYQVSGVKVDDLKQAIAKLINKHQVFRLEFFEGSQMIMQKEIENPAISIEVKRDNDIKQNINEFIQPFNLLKELAWRILIIETDIKQLTLVWDIHHIISDMMTEQIVIKQLFDILIETDSDSENTNYLDIIYQRQLEEESAELLKIQRKYWNDILENKENSVSMPLDYYRNFEDKDRGALYQFNLSKKDCVLIQSIAQAEKCTLHATLLTAYIIFLYSICGKGRFSIGSPTSVRHKLNEIKTPGLMLNVLPMVYEIDELASLRENLIKIDSLTQQYLLNRDIPFLELAKSYPQYHERGRNPLFDTMFIFRDLSSLHHEDENISLKPLRWDSKSSKVDLSLEYYIHEGELNFCFEYNQSLFQRSSIEEFTAIFKDSCKLLMQNLDYKISENCVLSSSEQKKMLAWSRGEVQNWPHKDSTNHTIFDYFNRNLKNNPEAIALISDDGRLNYREFDKKVSVWAAHILAKTPQKTIIALMMDRSLDMMVAIFAILKSGHAYLPLEDLWPKERINYMLNDSGTELLFSTKEKLRAFISPVLTLTVEECNDPSKDLINIKMPLVKAEDQAYIIYTSGSTGQPKGVVIEHKSLLSRLHWKSKYYPLAKEEVPLLKTPYTFDVSVWDIFRWAFEGVGLALLAPKKESEPRVIIDTIERYSITEIHFVPPMLDALLHDVEAYGDFHRLKSLRRVFCSGDVLKEDTVNRFNRIFYESYKTKLINLYGPTEATIDVSYFECASSVDQDVIPIGKPIDNVNLYILDEYKNLLLPKVEGDLYIGGEGLAKEYLNREDLTQERFIEDPFVKGQKMYATGDLAEWNREGQIIFKGRSDFQVKIRGHRIEIGEIEATISEIIPRDSFVVQAEDYANDKRLIAYLSQEILDNPIADIVAIKKHVAECLADYSRPSLYQIVSHIPITNNGKLHRKELKKHVIKSDLIENQPFSCNKQKSRFLKIISGLLDNSEINLNDDFFMIGGDSISLILLSSLIQKEYKIKISVDTLFQYSQLSEIFRIIEEGKQEFQDSLEITFNKNKGPRIFCFPPASGYGLAYREMATYLSEYELCCFNFLEQDDITDVYIAEILKRQGDMPLLLLGYSGGGNIAFKVAKKLESIGCKIDSLVFIDSFKKKSSLNELGPSLIKLKEILIEETIQKYSPLGLDENHILKRIDAYYQYCWLDEEDDGVLNCDVTHLESDDRNLIDIIGVDSPESRVLESWESGTRGEFIQIRGKGRHQVMLDKPHVESNAQVLAAILIRDLSFF